MFMRCSNVNVRLEPEAIEPVRIPAAAEVAQLKQA